MDKKPEKLVPEVRFKGFTDDWEQRKLRDVANLNGRIGFRGYTRKDIVNKDKGILAFSPTNIVSNKLIKTSKDTYITVKKYDESPEIKLKNGYVLFVKTGSTLGKSALIKELSQPATVNPQIVVIKPERINASFMSIILLNDKVQRQVFSRKIGGAVPTLTENEINNFNFNIPKTTEQQSISEIIECLNNFLSLQQRKLEQLKQLKKATLQQLFVDKNNKQPNLRFKNFNGNWEQRKLGELYSYHNGRAHEQNQKSNGKYELINLNSISIDGTLKPSGRYINHANEILRQNDLVMILSDIAHGKLLGRVAIIPQDNKYVLNQRVALLRPTSKNINSNFMVSLINNNQRYFHKMGIGTSQLNISKSTVTESLWQVPKIKEQLVVGKFLQNSAHVINLQQSKIDQLTILKKYLLQKLFI